MHKEYLEYEEKGNPIYFQRTKEGGFVCWKCGNNYQRIVRHLQFKESCRGIIDIDQFKLKLKEYNMDKSRKDQNLRKKKCTEKKRATLGDKIVKADQNAREKKKIDKKRATLGDKIVKAGQNARVKKTIDKKWGCGQTSSTKSMNK